MSVHRCDNDRALVRLREQRDPPGCLRGIFRCLCHGDDFDRIATAASRRHKANVLCQTMALVLKESLSCGGLTIHVEAKTEAEETEYLFSSIRRLAPTTPRA